MATKNLGTPEGQWALEMRVWLVQCSKRLIKSKTRPESLLWLQEEESEDKPKEMFTKEIIIIRELTRR